MICYGGVSDFNWNIIPKFSSKMTQGKNVEMQAVIIHNP